MKTKSKCILIIASLSSLYSFAQLTRAEKDSIYIEHIEDNKDPDKVLHAEPLFIDLIRDLGARKGEREWNIGLGLTDNLSFDSYEALIEYEWAPLNRLGVEVELPFTFYSANNTSTMAGNTRPSNQLNSVQIAELLAKDHI